MSEHARLSPSNHKWVYCPGSIREEDNYIDVSNAAAIDGTGSHLLLEKYLNSFYSIQDFLGTIIGVNHEDKPTGWLINQDRINRVNIALNYIDRRRVELAKEHPDSTIKIESECKSNPGEVYGRDDWWGTVDIVIQVIDKDGFQERLEVIDYKDGRIFVSEKNNPQLLAYLGGKVQRDVQEEKIEKFLKTDRLRMTIIQPKTNPPIRYSDVSSKDFKKELDSLLMSANLTDNPEAPLVPDKKNGKGYCRWCDHKHNCEARKNQLLGGMEMFIEQAGAQAQPLFEAISQTFKDITTMTPEMLSQMLDTKVAIDDIFEQIETEVQRRIESGDNIPGYAMQPGNGTKKWKLDDDELYKKLIACRLKKDDIYIPKMITPAQALKHPNLTDRQKDRIEKNYIDITPGNLTLKAVSKEEKTKEVIDSFKDVALQCKTSEVSFI